MPIRKRHLQHLLLPRRWYAWKPLHASLLLLLVLSSLLIRSIRIIQPKTRRSFSRTDRPIFYLATANLSWWGWDLCKRICHIVSALSRRYASDLCASTIGGFKRCKSLSFLYLSPSITTFFSLDLVYQWWHDGTQWFIIVVFIVVVDNRR